MQARPSRHWHARLGVLPARAHVYFFIASLSPSSSLLSHLVFSCQDWRCLHFLEFYSGLVQRHVFCIGRHSSRGARNQPTQVRFCTYIHTCVYLEYLSRYLEAYRGTNTLCTPYSSVSSLVHVHIYCRYIHILLYPQNNPNVLVGSFEDPWGSQEKLDSLQSLPFCQLSSHRCSIIVHTSVMTCWGDMAPANCTTKSGEISW